MVPRGIVLTSPYPKGADGMIRLLFLVCSLMALSAEALAGGNAAYFETPSRNIFCFYASADGYYKYNHIECEIREFTPSFPHSYSGNSTDPECVPEVGSCRADKLDRYVIESSSSTGLNYCPCMDIVNVIDNPDIIRDMFTLNYGETFERGGLTCLSERRGLTCENSSGHGFFLSKAKQSVF